MGLKFLVREDARLPQMSAVYVPKGVNEADVRRSLLNEFNLEIGAGLGPLAGEVWRFGLMGYSCKPENVMLCLSALGSVLMDAGIADRSRRGRRRPRIIRMRFSTRARRSRRGSASRRRSRVSLAAAISR